MWSGPWVLNTLNENGMKKNYLVAMQNFCVIDANGFMDLKHDWLWAPGKMREL